MLFKTTRTPMALLATLAAGAAWAGGVDLPTMEVTATGADDFTTPVVIPGEHGFAPPDSAQLLRQVPGANVNSNGPLTGIAQYRGLFGTRLNVRVDGLNVAPAGPNWMDPPLSNIPSALVEEISVVRGVSPVSAGAESLGGTVRAESRRGPFGTGPAYEFHGDLTLGGQTVNDGYNGAALLSLGNARHRFQVTGSYERGSDTGFGGGGRLTPSGYRRGVAGLGYGYRDATHELSLDYQHNRVDDAGTPALPMDIIYLDGDAFDAHYERSLAGGAQVTFRGHYLDTDHLMDNFTHRLRPVMAGMGNMPMRRFALTNSRDWAGDLQGELPMADGTLRLGASTWLADHQADVFNPDNAGFLIQNYNDIERDRYSLFGEWQGPVGGGWEIQVGARYTRVNASAGEVSASGLGMLQGAADTLAANFNAADRSQGDDLIDLTLLLTRALSDDLRLQLGLGRKGRAPSYQERYLWLPLESTAGLADTRVYVGDTDLAPETAYQIDVGLDWQPGYAYFTPRLFYSRIDDYIQGTPVTSGPAYMFRQMQGDLIKGGSFCTLNPTDPFCIPLQFTNVDAELYGLDAGYGVTLTDHWRLDGNLSYVRGRRRDIDDDLYRVAPLNASLAVTYTTSGWSTTAEGIFVASQDDVSVTNAEQTTPGYALLNLFGDYRFNRSLTLQAGVNNLFDRRYADHLAGYNRVSADPDGNPVDLAVGERLPGPGRNLFARLEAVF